MRSRDIDFIGRAKPVHPYQFLWEPLLADPAFELRSMFGTKAAYVRGNICLCFSAGEEPWRGVLVCTDRERQAALIADFPELRPHSILPKWLYLPESADHFERTAGQLVTLVRRGDPRIGVTPKPRKRRIRPDPPGVTTRARRAKPTE